MTKTINEIETYNRYNLQSPKFTLKKKVNKWLVTSIKTKRVKEHEEKDIKNKCQEWRVTGLWNITIWLLYVNE